MRYAPHPSGTFLTFCLPRLLIDRQTFIHLYPCWWVLHTHTHTAIFSGKQTLFMDTTKFNCNNPADQVNVANTHKITQATFDNYIANFWGSAVPTATIRTWTDMNNAMAPHNCEEMRWKFEADEYNLTNNDIDLNIEPVPTHEIIRNYSFALFKGVKALHNNVTEFHFFKAKKGDGSPDIIFKAVNNIGQPVYFGDVSDLYP